MSGAENDYFEEDSEQTQEHNVKQRPKDVVHVHVYRGDMSRVKPSTEDLSALMITGGGDVYGIGRNTVIGWEGSSPMPMELSGFGVVKDYVKVEALSGLGLLKIVVGLGFGAALARDNNMYMWGAGPKMILDTDEVVKIQENRKGYELCHCGNGENGMCVHEGGANLMYCQHPAFAPYFKVYTSTNPPPKDISVKAFAKFSSELILNCLNCGEPCSVKTMRYINYKLNYCQPCDLLREVEACDFLLSYNDPKPPYKVFAGIVDISCSHGFFCTLSENNEVTLWTWKNLLKLEIPINVPENVTVKAVSCGTRHFAFLTGSGDLYIFSGGYNWKKCMESFKEPLKLTKVNTPAPVEKVCCGDQMTLCLLADRTIWFSNHGASQKRYLKRSLPNSNLEFSDIHSHQLMNTFFGMEDTIETVIFENPMRNHNNPWIEEEVHKLVTEVMKKSSEMEDMAHFHNWLPHWMSRLYGNQQMSDLTLKLSDGQIPVHRVVLYGTSNYFKNLIRRNTTATQDMTSYNPRAYRVLLQYFYQVQPDELGLNDLFDLCTIATSYNERFIVNAVVAKLKSLTTIDNVLEMLPKAKSAGNNALVDECKKLMCSPAFRDHVTNALFKSPSKGHSIFKN